MRHHIVQNVQNAFSATYGLWLSLSPVHFQIFEIAQYFAAIFAEKLIFAQKLKVEILYQRLKRNFEFN